jgi:hypothetical protein
MAEIPGSRFRAVLSVLLMGSVQLSSLSLYMSDVMAQVQGEGLTVWIPPKMLAGEKYSGVVIVSEVSDFAKDILLVSSNPAVAVPELITVEPGMHQAVFSIDVQPGLTLSAAATVSAVMGGAFGEASTALYDRHAGGNSMVRLLAFNSTSLSFARVVVVSGQPAGIDYSSPSTDTDVTLVYPGGEVTVSIDDMAGYGVIDVPIVDGANRISIFGRPGDSITVTRTPVEVALAVKVAALPTIPSWTPEWGYQKSWILVDMERNGKPVRGDFEVVATSSNPDILEVEKGRSVCSLPCAIPVRGHTEGEAQVGIQVTGIGGGTVDIETVPPVRYMAKPADIENVARRYITQIVGASGQFVINSTSFSSHWSEKAASSTVTDGPVYGIVGHYAILAANYTTIEAAGNMTTLVPGQFSKTVPLVIPGVKYHMSSYGGLTQVEWSFFSGLLRGDIGRGSSALTGGVPSTVVRSTSVGMGSSHAAMSSFDVQINEPLGPAELKGELTAITLPEIGLRLAGYLVNGTVRGYHAENKGVSLGVVPSFSVPDIVQVQPAQTGPQLQVDVPPIVYPAEGFAFAAHIAQGGIPLQRVDPLYELGRADPDRAGDVQEIDAVFIHSSSRQVAKVTIHAVMNAIELDVLWPDVLKLDRPQDLSVITSIPDARIQVSGDVRGTYSSDSGKATLYPAGAEGEKKVVITASKAGWVTATAEKVLPAKRFVNITVDAMDVKGNPVSAPFTLEYETVDGDTGIIQDTTPYAFDLRPFASKPVMTFGTAPEDLNDGSSYVYRSTRETDSGFTGIYERQTRLTVINGIGSGYYVTGQSVRVEADLDSQILGFAVVEKFSHWQYDTDSVYVRDRTARVHDVVLGDADATITAVYVTDFGTLAILVLATAAAVAVYAYREEIRTILEAYRKRA